jgi:uncharacterized membrane protein
MPRLTVFGHPVHPILQAIPASPLPVSTTFDALARFGIDEEGLSKAAHYSLVFGLLGAAGAAATGSPAILGASWSTSTGCGLAKTTTAYRGRPRREHQAMRKEMSTKCCK